MLKQSLTKAKARAWHAFSLYIRLRDCNAVSKGGMYCPCITCGQNVHFSKLQAGHFLSGRGNAILFDEESVFAQCQQCNIFKHGNSDAYWPVMLRKYGQDKCMELVKRKHQIQQLKTQDYLDLYEKYYKKFSDLGGLNIVKLPKPPKQEKLV